MDIPREREYMAILIERGDTATLWERGTFL